MSLNRLDVARPALHTSSPCPPLLQNTHMPVLVHSQVNTMTFEKKTMCIQSDQPEFVLTVPVEERHAQGQ